MTGLWRGRFSARIDAKGRVHLPAGLSPESTKSLSVFVTNNIFHSHKFLDLYPEKEWLKLESKINSMPAFDSDVQAFRRFFISSAVKVDVDSQGRVLIPQELREYAQFSEELVIVGVHNHLEIWDRGSWKKFHEGVNENFDQIIKTIAEFESGKKK